MKKIYFIAFISLISVLSVQGAETWIQVLSKEPARAEKKLIQSNIENTTLQFVVPGFMKGALKTPRGAAYIIQLDGATSILEKGMPDLPKMTASVIIPDEASMGIRVVSTEYQDFFDVAIAPSKGNFTRDIDPESVPYTYDNTYDVNAFYPHDITGLRDPHIVRDYRGQTLVVFPFQYNPVSKVLRVHYNIIVEVYHENDHGTNPLIRKNNLEKVNDEFQKIYKHHFLNAENTRYDPVDEQGSMLVICYGEFMDAMQDFVDWKTTIGIPTEIVDIASIGNNANTIKTYISDYYNAHDLAYVLLVGDDAQVTSSYASGDSDNDYSYIVGNDHYPDIFVGRFSAETTEEVETQVTKTLEYEQNPNTDMDWFSQGIGIASSQGPGDDNEYDYEHIRVIQEKLLNYTYSSCSELFDGSQGGLDEPGNPNPSMVAEDVNQGASIMNYTGHGSTNSWSSSGFSSTHVNQLTNNGMYPFIWSVACVNGNFTNTTCFAENWLRATHNGEPSGAIATLMSTINQSWDPPMCGQDAMNDILVESFTNNIKRSFGGISMNGCMQMNDEYGSSGTQMTDTWNCFGDPSVMVRTALPNPITANYNSTLFIGADQLSVTTPLEEGRVTLTKDHEIIATAPVNAGTAILEFEAFTGIGTLTLAITAYNHIPHIAEIDVIPAEGPYVVYHDATINDLEGNSNGLADYGETIYLSIGLENAGIEEATEVLVVLESNDEYLSIIDGEETYASIPAGEILSLDNGFRIEIDNEVPDNHNMLFQLTATDADSNTWNSSFTLLAHAPVMLFKEFSIDDSQGNNNGRFDPGETVELLISIENAGSAAAYEISGWLGSFYQLIEIENQELPYGSIEPGSFSEQSYQMSCPVIVPQGTSAGFGFTYFSSGNEIDQYLFDLEIGHPQILILDLDQSPLSGLAFRDLLTEKGITPRYLTEFPEQISEDYKVIFTCLGIYPNNHVLSSSSGAQLATYLNEGGKLYMEGGDTWYYDDQTQVHNLFSLEAVEDGSGDLGTLQGVEETFTANDVFEYDGENSYIDRLQPSGNGFDIFNNQNPGYTCAVAHDAAIYQTIGASFEFGGLIDDTHTKSELLDQYLDFYGVSFPGQPEPPNGPQQICSNETESNYHIACLEGISYYYWQIYPASAGSILGNDTAVTVVWNDGFTGEAYIEVCGMNDIGMGDMSDVLWITVNQSPQITLGSDTVICYNHALYLSPGGAFVSYEWMDGSTQSYITIDSTFGEAGSVVTVNVMVTDTNGCTGEAAILVELNECATIDDTHLQNLIDIYPNPSDGYIHIDVRKVDMALSHLSVFSAMGDKLFSIDLSPKDHYQLDLQHFGQGIYFVAIDTKTGKITRKVIIR